MLTLWPEEAWLSCCEDHRREFVLDHHLRQRVSLHQGSGYPGDLHQSGTELKAQTWQCRVPSVYVRLQLQKVPQPDW